MAASNAASSYSTAVQELYITYFGRPADYFGLQNFEAALAAANAPTDMVGLNAAYATNPAVKALIDSFGTSQESTNLYGGGSTAAFVTAIFENLFNRAPAVAGLSFWSNAIDSGQVTKGDAALAIAAGAEINTTPQGVIDAATVANKVAVASEFTTDLGASSTSIVAYSGASAAAIARGLIAGITNTSVPADQTTTVQQAVDTITNGVAGNIYNLTTGTDNFVGNPGNNTFNAVLDNAVGVTAGGQAATLNEFDKITGGTLLNTLNISDFGLGYTMQLPATAVINGITALNISSLEAIGANIGDVQDFSTWAGLASVNVKTSSGDDFIRVGTNTTLFVKQVSPGGGEVFTFGGSTVGVSDPATGYAQIAGGAATTSVNVNGGGVAIYDLHSSQWGGLTPGTNTIATVSLSSIVGETAVIDSDALTSLTLTGGDAATVLVHAAAGTRALNLDLNGAGTNLQGIIIADDTATTLHITATGAASFIALEATAATSITCSDAAQLGFGSIPPNFDAPLAKTLTISGTGDFYGVLNDLYATAAVDASASGGTITATLAAGQSFVGGSGQDVVTIGSGQTGLIVGGSAQNNEIILKDIGGVSASVLAPTSHFSILGVYGATYGVFDMSNAPGYTAFDVQGNFVASEPLTFTHVASGASLTVEGNDNNIVTYQTADTTGASDSVNLSIGFPGSPGITDQQITLEDNNFVGIGTVYAVSSVTHNSAHGPNTITLLGDNNLVTLNLSGSGALDIGTILNDVSPIVTFNNAGGTSVSTIAGLSDNFLTTLAFGGSEATTLTALTSTATSPIVTDSDTATVTITSLNDAALTSATFTDSVSTTTLHVGPMSEAALATLNLNGNVAVAIDSVAVTTGITVAGSTDNANVIFTTTGAATAAGKTDSVTLGNGVDGVILGAGVPTSTQTIVLGNGAGDEAISTSTGTVNITVGTAASSFNTIEARGAGANVHVTAGNGTNIIVADGAGASVSIAVGTGDGNQIVTGVGANGSVSVGSHSGMDALVVNAIGSASTVPHITISGLNNAGADLIGFNSDGSVAVAVGGIVQMQASNVVSSGGNTTLFSSWLAAATGGAGSGIANAAHGIVTFQFQGNTYLVETVGAGDHGVINAADAIIELTGTGYTFSHSYAAGGLLALLG
jgi:S-layer protein